MKKILLINPYHHSQIGGISTYARYLIKVGVDNLYKVEEIYFFKPQSSLTVAQSMSVVKSHWLFENQPQLWAKISKCHHDSKRNSKIIAKALESFDLSVYDVVIINWHYPLNLDYGASNIVLVQHYDAKFYKRKLKHNNIFAKAHQVVLFDKQHQINMNLADRKVNLISLPYQGNIVNIDDLNFKTKTEVVYLGRLDWTQKNTPYLIRVAREIGHKLHVYGAGSRLLNFLCQKNPKIVFHNTYQQNQIPRILKNAKVLVVTSNHEGFCFVIAEALANGVPVIVRDTFSSAQFLLNQKRNGVLLHAKDNYSKFAGAVDQFMCLDDVSYKIFVNNCINFANSHLRFELFHQKWSWILKLVTRKVWNF